MSKPPIDPEKTVAGIAVDPVTLERVVPESRRPDGTVRKQIKIRPGFTPQEDVSRFRGKKQAQMDANALPKGHIIGWVPPSSETKPMSKSAKKNAKRKEKRAAEKSVKDDWEDDDEDNAGEAESSSSAPAESKPTETQTSAAPPPPAAPAPKVPSTNTSTPSQTPPATTPAPETRTRPTPRPPRNTGGLAGRLAAELNKLNVNK